MRVLKHPNILHLIGVNMQEYIILTALCMHRSVFDYYTQVRQASLTPPVKEPHAAQKELC